MGAEVTSPKCPRLPEYITIQVKGEGWASSRKKGISSLPMERNGFLPGRKHVLMLLKK